MLTMRLSEWVRYRDILSKLSAKAAEEFSYAVWNKNGRFKGVGLGGIDRDELIDYAYALVTKYSEGATAVACEYYDEIAALSGATVPAAVPAETASYGEVAKTLNGTINRTLNEEAISAALGRLVKQAGQDTTLQNAKRDGAQVAWIPAGLTCAYCISFAADGWNPVTRRQADEHDHARHIHPNCDCAYAIRFNGDTEVEGYDPARYHKLYFNGGETSKDKINAIRRKAYWENREEINEQKRSAYEKRKERESSAAEEVKTP